MLDKINKSFGMMLTLDVASRGKVYANREICGGFMYVRM